MEAVYTGMASRWLSGNESPADARDAGSIPGPGRAPGGEKGNTLPYSYLDNSTDRGAWRARLVQGVAKSRT